MWACLGEGIVLLFGLLNERSINRAKKEREGNQSMENVNLRLFLVNTKVGLFNERCILLS